MLCNTEGELKKSVTYKKKSVSYVDPIKASAELRKR